MMERFEVGIFQRSHVDAVVDGKFALSVQTGASAGAVTGMAETKVVTHQQTYAVSVKIVAKFIIVQLIVVKF